MIRETRLLVARCFPLNSAATTNGGTGACSVVSVYCRHLGCLFPQHGPGRKHDRGIVLEGWQETLVDAAPWALLRGLIRSDGSHFINHTGPYDYLSYEFSNRSAGIVGLFVRACEATGLTPRVNWNARRKSWHIRLNRRKDVARLAINVGFKL